MNKKICNYFFITFLWLIIPRAFSEQTLPDTTLNIALDVVNITCNINDGQGFNKIVDFGVIDEAKLLSGKIPEVKTQFIVDCQKSGFVPENIDIKFHSGSQGALNLGLDGKLKTNLSGVIVQLSWPDGTPVNLSGVNNRIVANDKKFDISFFSRPYAQHNAVEKGIMKSSVVINMLYK